MTDWQSIHGDYFNGVRVLVTGGTGSIGSHLSEALVRLGAHVVVLDDLSGSDGTNLQSFTTDGNPEFVEGSILDEDTLAREMEHPRFGTITGRWLVGHIIVEESQHTGQVALVRGMMRGFSK